MFTKIILNKGKPDLHRNNNFIDLYKRTYTSIDYLKYVKFVYVRFYAKELYADVH